MEEENKKHHTQVLEALISTFTSKSKFTYAKYLSVLFIVLAAIDFNRNDVELAVHFLKIVIDHYNLLNIRHIYLYLFFITISLYLYRLKAKSVNVKKLQRINRLEFTLKEKKLELEVQQISNKINSISPKNLRLKKSKAQANKVANEKPKAKRGGGKLFKLLSRGK